MEMVIKEQNANFGSALSRKFLLVSINLFCRSSFVCEEYERFNVFCLFLGRRIIFNLYSPCFCFFCFLEYSCFVVDFWKLGGLEMLVFVENVRFCGDNERLGELRYSL